MNWHGIPDHLVHAALGERRATVAHQAERARFALADAERTLAALDIVMALYEPQPQLALPAPKASRRAHTSLGDNVSRNVLDILRDAGEPMPLDRIAFGVLAMRGIEPSRRMMRDAAMRAYNALQRHTASGILRQMAKPDGKQAWEVAR